ncbi:MAG: zf-HC2 domain-containing protein, partial [Myxococcales bacterium]|nr:zf-HC2 domain-containing protein [Myxococcales bacterium]
MDCPNFESLFSEEHQSHLDACETCRTMISLAALDRPNPDACEEVDGLIGLAAELTPEDSGRLEGHLAECPACMVTYLSAVSDAEVSDLEPAPSWKGAGMEIAVDPQGLGARTAMVSGVVLAAAALLWILVSRQGDDERVVVLESPQPVAELVPGASRPSVEPTTSTLPATPTAKVTSSPKNRISELLALSESAFSDGRDAVAIEYCSEATEILPDDERTVFLCLLSYCTGEQFPEDFDQLVENIHSPLLQDRAAELCDSRHEGWTPGNTCDEVTCLVTPNKLCCARLDTQEQKKERERKQQEKIAVLVKMGTDSVDALVEQARSAARVRQYEESLEGCEAALIVAPDHQAARLVCGIAACNLRMKERAVQHIDELEGASKRAAVRQICIRNE